MEIICDYLNKNCFNFNYDKLYKENTILLEDFDTKKTYIMHLIGEKKWWMSIIDSAKGYSFYRTSDKSKPIVLVVIPEKLTEYICLNNCDKKYVSKIIVNSNGEKEYYLSDNCQTKYKGLVFEIICEEYIEYDIETVNIETINNNFKLKSIIYALREKYCK